MEYRGGGVGGGGDDHDVGSKALSPNDDDDGAEEEEAAINIVEDKGEGFATGSTSICQDDAATMTDALPPLIVLSRDCPSSGTTERQARRMRRHPQATTAAKVGVVSCATASSGAVKNAMDTFAWRQSRTSIDDNNDDEDNNQC
jgi:hypothetical protein